MESLNKKKDKYLFIYVILFILFIFISVTVVMILIIQNNNLDIYKIAVKIVILLTFIGSMLLIINVFLISRIIGGRRINHYFMKVIEKSIKIIFPLMIAVSNILKVDKNSLRRVFSEINNKIVKLKDVKIEPKDILVIAPHCLQKTFCKYKVTGSIKNCNKCGACNISDLIYICEKYGVNLEIVTGGTLARKLIVDYNPKGIIAIACERDLSYGILDVKSVPIIGVTNIRPEGPCVNTCVNLQEVEKAIIFFTGGI